MKRLLFIYACLILMNSPVFAGEAQYSTLIDDLPLMQGMVENQDKSLVFEKPTGRIIEAFAVINAKKDAITTFYKKNLPALGWKHQSELNFSRDGEQLTIFIKKSDKQHEIRFLLKPKI